MVRRKINIVAFVTLFFSSCFLGSNNSKQADTPLFEDGLEYCINKDLSTVGADKITPSLYKNSRNQFLKTTGLKEWINSIEEDNLKLYILSDGIEKYIMFCSTAKAATGLASNFYNWLVFDLNRDSIISKDLMTLSSNPNAFYIENEHLFFIEYKFGESFYIDKDFDNPEIIRVKNILEKMYIKKVSSCRIICD